MLKLNEHNRIILYPNSTEKAKIPQMPLVIFFNDGTVGEAKTVRGAVSLIVGNGNEYMDAEDELDDWHHRVEAARRYSMVAIAQDVYAVVYDMRKGIIESNYGADAGDTDYEADEDGNPQHIRVEDDMLFILSLMKLGLIRVLEREDGFLLRKASGDDGGQCCGSCLYKEAGAEGGKGLMCSVYQENKDENGGTTCASYGAAGSRSLDEYPKGVYIDVVLEQDIDGLMAEWEKKIK